MSEQADSSDNVSIPHVVYLYRHKRIKTSDDDDIKTEIVKFVSSGFFGSSFATKNQELQEMEKKLLGLEQTIKARNSQLRVELLCLLKQAEAGKLDYKQYRKWRALTIVERYMINKEEDEVQKLKEDYEKLEEEMIGQHPGSVRFSHFWW